jgi:GTPase SAR1 family protein
MKRNVKIVVVGDGSCGKTSLIVAHSVGQFNDQYVPTAFDEYRVEALVNGKTVSSLLVLNYFDGVLIF